MYHNFDLINKTISCKRDVLRAFEAQMSLDFFVVCFELSLKVIWNKGYIKQFQNNYRLRLLQGVMYLILIQFSWKDPEIIILKL